MDRGFASNQHYIDPDPLVWRYKNMKTLYRIEIAKVYPTHVQQLSYQGCKQITAFVFLHWVTITITPPGWDCLAAIREISGSAIAEDIETTFKAL